MMTPWGYELDSLLEPIVSHSDFYSMTDGTYASNPRVEMALLAASQAIRNRCGWHICPSAVCTAYPNGGSNILRLPAGYISGIISVTEDGVIIPDTDYAWRRDGLVKRKEHMWTPNWGGLSVVYTAGYEANAAPDLAEAVRSITEGVLAVSAGVTSESADGVTISYSLNASSIANALVGTGSYDTMLAPYKVVNAHAT